MKRFWMMMGVIALLAACGDDPADEEESSENRGEDTGTGEEDTGTGDAEPLEIAGSYTTEWQTITISNTEWIDDSGDFGVFEYDISTYDNERDFLVAQGTDDELWDRFEWTVSSDTLYYCQILFDVDSEEEAESDENLADADDLDEGCDGFSWTELTPA